MGVGRSGLRESPQAADVSKVATGDRAKTAAPPPELPGKENLKDILGRPVGEGSQQLKTKWIVSPGQARLCRSCLDDMRDQEEVQVQAY